MIPHRGFGYHSLDEGQLVVHRWKPEQVAVVLERRAWGESMAVKVLILRAGETFTAFEEALALVDTDRV